MKDDAELPAGTMRFTILGCGSSPGVPRIGPDWGNCNPDNPKNRRRRASLLIEKFGTEGKTVVVVDSGPDFREQMISANIGWADAVIYTHPHADHIHGIDDLRSFVINRRKLADVWMDENTSKRIHEAFGYCFQTPEGSQYPPILVEHRITTGEGFSVNGQGGSVDIIPFEQQHGGISSLGFRIGALAYCSDVSDFDERALPYLSNLDVWILDALQYKEHPSHLSLAQSVDWVEKLNAKRAILTHMHTPLDYDAVMSQTPDNIEPAYDGMQIILNSETAK